MRQPRTSIRFYCLNVGTFVDAHGDGAGNFEGLMRCFDDLAGLGVTALWLMPCQGDLGPRPQRTTKKQQIVGVYLSGITDIEELARMTNARASYVGTV